MENQEISDKMGQGRERPEDNEPIIVTENVLDQHYEYLRDPSGYTVYTRRWFLLFVIAVINFTNAMIWIMFSPVTDKTSQYYGVDPTGVNWLSLVFLVASIPCGFMASWLLDTLGLRASIICAAWLNFLGSVIRNLTAYSFMPHSAQFPVLIFGQVVAACGQTFVMFTPAKTAALWFPDSQRTIANTLASMSNPLGILAANVLSPALIKKSDDLPVMLYICTGASLFGVLLSTFGVCSSVPPSPPSPSAAAQSEPFFLGIKKLRKNFAFWMLAFSMGGGLALFSAYTTFLEQILCPQNYDNSFAGLCGALMIAAGAVGAVIAGVIADKTRKFSEVTKLGFVFSNLAGIAFVQLARYRDLEYPVAICITLFGAFGFAVYPTALELAVEVTYPVAEATSTGIIFISGQVQGIVLMIISQYIAQPLSPHAASLPQACPSDGEFDPQDWTIPNLLGNGMGVLYTVAIVLLFRAEYKRMKVEDRHKIEQTLQGEIDSPVRS
ncbi:solute carrier family 49 member A3 [Aplysia californica]|uniref:Solute carrier family 49 member A3 n=2 Tax=Aplysia californica TaxID=6500 RepID=A0ABM1A1D8_APLCA|nr:solute carrier family 49 member A3 [Aplysia californica]